MIKKKQAQKLITTLIYLFESVSLVTNIAKRTWELFLNYIYSIALLILKYKVLFTLLANKMIGIIKMLNKRSYKNVSTRRRNPNLLRNK